MFHCISIELSDCLNRDNVWSCSPCLKKLFLGIIRVHYKVNSLLLLKNSYMLYVLDITKLISLTVRPACIYHGFVYFKPYFNSSN